MDANQFEVVASVLYLGFVWPATASPANCRHNYWSCALG